MSELTGSELRNWRDLDPENRQQWWQQLWISAITLSSRYRLGLRSGWWEDQIQVEALAAFAAWVELYDTGMFTDPPGKLQLLGELDPLRARLRGGESAFDPGRDRAWFERHLAGFEAGDQDQPDPDPAPAEPRPDPRALELEIAAVIARRSELEQRQQALQQEVDRDRRLAPARLSAELAELQHTLACLQAEEDQLQAALDEGCDG